MNEEGDIANPETLVLKADYMFLQDLGSSTYTEFEHDDVAEHIMDNEELMEYKVGLIHSHHTMKAFFSGTDTEELHEKAENGLYLSLIVNNHMEPVAKLAWMGMIERKIEEHKGWDFGGYFRKPKKTTKTELAKCFYEVELDIEWDECIAPISDRYQELAEEEEIRKAAKSVHKGWGGIRNFGTQGDFFGDKPSDKAREKTQGESKMSFLETLQQKGIFSSSMGSILTQDPKTEVGLVGGLAAAMEEVRQVVKAVDETNDTKGKEFMELFEEEAMDHARVLIEGGDDIIAEKMGEFYIDDEDYHELLTKMYELLEEHHNGIMVKCLLRAILETVLEDEDQIEAEAAEQEANAASASSIAGFGGML